MLKTERKKERKQKNRRRVKCILEGPYMACHVHRPPRKGAHIRLEGQCSMEMWCEKAMPLTARHQKLWTDGGIKMPTYPPEGIPEYGETHMLKAYDFSPVYSYDFELWPGLILDCGIYRHSCSCFRLRTFTTKTEREWRELERGDYWNTISEKKRCHFNLHRSSAVEVVKWSVKKQGHSLVNRCRFIMYECVVYLITECIYMHK